MRSNRSSSLRTSSARSARTSSSRAATRCSRADCRASKRSNSDDSGSRSSGVCGIATAGYLLASRWLVSNGVSALPPGFRPRPRRRETRRTTARRVIGPAGSVVHPATRPADTSLESTPTDRPLPVSECSSPWSRRGATLDADPPRGCSIDAQDRIACSDARPTDRCRARAEGIRRASPPTAVFSRGPRRWPFHPRWPGVADLDRPHSHLGSASYGATPSGIRRRRKDIDAPPNDRSSTHCCSRGEPGRLQQR